MKDIENRDDVSLLVSSFYKHIRTDTILGPIFNSHIEDEKWLAHLEKLTDFWMTNLFGIVCFKGNPSLAHKKVDENLKYTIDQKHFEQWLNIWFDTIDMLFSGQLAQRAKDSARKMAAGQYISIWRHRPSLRNEFN